MSMTEKRLPSFLHRWYDQDLHVSGLVRMMEHLTPETQYLVALLLGGISEVAIANRGRTRFVQELDWDRIIGLMKSKRGRRWYDEEPEMHKAFNLLYSLEDVDKAWVGEQLYVPVMLVETYEERCRLAGRDVDLEIVCDIVETTFKSGTAAAEEKFINL